MTATDIPIRVQVEKEVREIAQDFQRPVEVLREALANAYDAGAQNVQVKAKRGTDVTGNATLDLELSDDGEGMDTAGLSAFFGLGISQKSGVRPAIGHKGHGTKVYYLAREVWVATRRKGGDLFVAHVPEARARVHQTQLPQPRVWMGAEAEALASANALSLGAHGTLLRLVDFTANSGRLIDAFKRAPLESYLRWSTLFGSFAHVVAGTSPEAPLNLLLEATDDKAPRPVAFGHDWPQPDIVEHKALKAKDDRRPFNYFRKTFRRTGWPISGGHTIDLAVLFEGKKGRLERDKNIRRQGPGEGLYTEEERYGLWLARDFIPIELRSEWLQDERLDLFADIEPKRALVLVNCQAFRLTANRGSVGNSDSDLLRAVRDGVIDFIRKEVEDDKDIQRFREEYVEERHQRDREKDGKALGRRIERFNKAQLCRIVLASGQPFSFVEPSREITLYGVVAQLQALDPELLGFDILDYDDHHGVDLLVSRKPAAGDQLARNRVAYLELKYELHTALNHAFQNLHAIVCWRSAVAEGGVVRDVTGEAFDLTESKPNGRTHTRLSPRPGSPYEHQVTVIVLERLLREVRGLQTEANPRRIKK